MLHELTKKIANAETVQKYEQAVKELADYLFNAGEPEMARKLTEVGALRNNRFSRREAEGELAAGKEAVADYLRFLPVPETTTADSIMVILENFPLFCRNLYKTGIHERCSLGIKEHLKGFSIENEYDLQKLMIAALSAVFTDVRTESFQDSGHHAVRKDIVIDSKSAVIELKCTRSGMTERQLSEEIAADMIHYDCKRLFFYIYDKACIIRNVDSFKETYEKRSIEGKVVKVFIYNHSDI